jgi:hypothetical protein
MHQVVRRTTEQGGSPEYPRWFLNIQACHLIVIRFVLAHVIVNRRNILFYVFDDHGVGFVNFRLICKNIFLAKDSSRIETTFSNCGVHLVRVSFHVLTES